MLIIIACSALALGYIFGMIHNYPRKSGNAVKALSYAFKLDPDFAWTWHCNLAMMAIDAGAPYVHAQRSAANFMKTLFGADTSTNRFYSEAHEPAINYKTELEKMRNRADKLGTENAELIVKSMVMYSELRALDGPSGFGNCSALEGLTRLEKTQKCMQTIRTMLVILLDYPKGQDDGTWIKRVEAVLKENMC